MSVHSEDSLRVLWAESERRLYPLATSVPERYEQVVLLARAVANRLGDISSSAELVARWADAEAIVAEALADSALPGGGFAPVDVAGLAFSVRMREVKELEHQSEQTQRIANAQVATETWVDLHQRGSLEQGLMDPYSKIELHLASGAAMVSAVEQNPADGTANYVLTVIRMDTTNGRMIDADPGILPVSECSTSAGLLEAVDSARMVIEEL